jgi:hypothetical protein
MVAYFPDCAKSLPMDAPLSSGRHVPINRIGNFPRMLSAMDSRLSLPASGSAASDALLAELRELTVDGAPRFVSLDVFDTLLLRNGKCEARRFWEISHRIRCRMVDEEIRPGLATADVFTARYLAMRAGYACDRSLQGCREGQIQTVITTQIDLLGLPADVQAVFLGIELDYEAENVVGNEFLLAAIRQVFGEVPLIGISDMYLGADQIALLVDRTFGGRCRLQRIFSSADIVLNKRSGNAYAFVADSLQAGNSDILHIGDNVQADLIQSRLAGFRALLFPVTHTELAARRHDLDAFLQERQREGMAFDEMATL